MGTVHSSKTRSSFFRSLSGKTFETTCPVELISFENNLRLGCKFLESVKDSGNIDQGCIIFKIPSGVRFVFKDASTTTKFMGPAGTNVDVKILSEVSVESIECYACFPGEQEWTKLNISDTRLRHQIKDGRLQLHKFTTYMYGNWAKAFMVYDPQDFLVNEDWNSPATINEEYVKII